MYKCVGKMRRFAYVCLLNYSNLETRIRGHSRSPKVTPLDNLPMVSY